MVAFPTDFTHNLNVPTAVLWADANRSQLAQPGQQVLAIGSTSGDVELGGGTVSIVNADAGITVSSLGANRSLKFQGTDNSRVNFNSFIGLYNGNDFPMTVALVYLYPEQAAGAVRYLMRMWRDGAGNSLANIMVGSTGTLNYFRRQNSGAAQIGATISPVVKQGQLSRLLLRFNADPAGVTVPTLDVWLDGVQVITALEFNTGSLDMNRLEIGRLFNGEIGRFTLWNRVLSDQDVADTNAAMLADWPDVLPPVAVNVQNGNFLLRGLSYSGHSVPVFGTVSNLVGVPHSMSYRILRQTDKAVVRGATNTGVTFEGSNFLGGAITNIPGGGPYDIEYIIFNQAGTEIARVVSPLTINVGPKVLMIGSSTPERLGYEYTGAAPATSSLFQANIDAPGVAAWKFGESQGAGVRRISSTLTGITGLPTIIVNAAVGGTSFASWQSPTASGMSVALRALQQVGTDIDAVVIGVGANNAFKTHVGVSTVESAKMHAENLRLCIQLVLNAVGKSDIPVIVAGMNNRLFDADQPIGSDGSARGTMGRAGEMLYAESIARGLYVSSMDSGVFNNDIHLTQGGQELLGTRIGEALGIVLGATMRRYHPKFTHETQVPDGSILHLSHTTGTDLAPQPVGGYSGFRVYDDLRNIVYDSEFGPALVTRHSASSVHVPFVRNPDRAYFVMHQNGTWTKMQGSMVKDNNGLVAEPTKSGIGEIKVQSGERVLVTN